MHEHDWESAQKEEREWWGDCANTLGEELKQTVYARYLGLHFKQIDGLPYQIDLHGDKVLDIGGGPTSLLLKSFNFAPGTRVIDPCEYPVWVYDRYRTHGVGVWQDQAENLSLMSGVYDEVWMYNCLQHVDDPELIIKNGFDVLKPGGVFRIFEWIDTEINEAHPHSLTSEDFHRWTGQYGGIVHLNELGAVGTAYYDVVVKGE